MVCLIAYETLNVRIRPKEVLLNFKTRELHSTLMASSIISATLLEIIKMQHTLRLWMECKIHPRC